MQSFRKSCRLIVAISTGFISTTSLLGFVPAARAQGDVLVQEIEYKVALADATPCPTAPAASPEIPCTKVDAELETLRNFKMNAPSDWNVKFNTGGYAVYMEPMVKRRATPDNPMVADPNIGVSVVRNPMPIDAEGLEPYAQEVEKNLNKNEMGIEGEKIFTVFNSTMLDLNPGHKAYLYYVQGSINGLPVRQAILVASTDKVRYRVQLTDDAVSFDKTLERYFPVLTSLQLKGPPMKRVTTLEQFAPWIVALFLLIGLVFVTRLILARRTERLIAEVSASSGGGEKSDESKGQFPPISEP